MSWSASASPALTVLDDSARRASKSALNCTLSSVAIEVSNLSTSWSPCWVRTCSSIFLSSLEASANLTVFTGQFTSVVDHCISYNNAILIQDTVAIVCTCDCLWCSSRFCIFWKSAFVDKNLASSLSILCRSRGPEMGSHRIAKEAKRTTDCLLQF